MEKSEIKREVY